MLSNITIIISNYSVAMTCPVHSNIANNNIHKNSKYIVLGPNTSPNTNRMY